MNRRFFFFHAFLLCELVKQVFNLNQFKLLLNCRFEIRIYEIQYALAVLQVNSCTAQNIIKRQFRKTFIFIPKILLFSVFGAFKIYLKSACKNISLLFIALYVFRQFCIVSKVFCGDFFSRIFFNEMIHRKIFIAFIDRYMNSLVIFAETGVVIEIF